MVAFCTVRYKRSFVAFLATFPTAGIQGVHLFGRFRQATGYAIRPRSRLYPRQRRVRTVPKPVNALKLVLFFTTLIFIYFLRRRKYVRRESREP